MNAFLVFTLLATSFSYVNTQTTCICTTVPCPVVGTNKLSAGGGGFGIYNYALHNDIPVIYNATVTITNVDLDHGTDTTTCTQSYSRMLDDDGKQDCDAGHILANRLGGKGNQPINIFPQDLSINRGSYAQYENTIYDCFTNAKVIGTLRWLFVYSNETQTKPVEVHYTAEFDGSSCTSLSQKFTN